MPIKLGTNDEYNFVINANLIKAMDKIILSFFLSAKIKVLRCIKTKYGLNFMDNRINRNSIKKFKKSYDF